MYFFYQLYSTARPSTQDQADDVSGQLHSDSQTVTGFRRGLVRVAPKDVVLLPCSPTEAAIQALTGEALSTRALAGAPLSAAFSEASSSAACSEVQLQHSATSEAVYRPQAPTKQANAKSSASL